MNDHPTLINGLIRTLKYGICISLFLGAVQIKPHARNTISDSLENILHSVKTDTAKVNVLNAFSMQCIHISDFTKAIQYADSALKLAEKINFQQGKADAYGNLALQSFGQSDYPQALRYNHLALKTRELTGDKKGIASTYGNISSVYLEQGDYSTALEFAGRSLAISEEIGYTEGIANAHYNLGLIHYKQGIYSESMKHLLASLKAYEKIDHPRGAANAYNWMGNVYKEQGNYDDAMKYYLVSLEMKELIGDQQGIAYTKLNMGIIDQKEGNYAKALERYAATLKIVEEIGDKYAISKTNCFIGQIHYNQENFPRALESFQLALKISEEIGRYPMIAWARINLGKLHIRLGDYREARKQLEEALSLSMQYGNKVNIQDSYRYLAELNIAEGDFENAVSNYMSFTAYKDSLFNEESKNKLTQLEFQFETEKKDREIELLNKDKALKEEQLEKQRLLLNGVIAGTALLLVVAILLFRSFRLRKKFEHQQATIEERNRISADLHDEIGSGLSRIILHSEMVKKVAKTQETMKGVEKIAAISDELSSNISEIIWALNSNNDFAEDLVAYIRRYAAEYFENSPVRLKIKTPSKMEQRHISGEHRRNLFYAVKEALHNIIKHSQATEAEVKFTLKQDVLSVVISDNGTGIDEEAMNRFGNGLNNMKKRMKSIKGDCLIENRKGTRITLVLPV